MNVTQKGIITLLKSAILQQSLPLPADFDMEAAYPLIKSHHIVTMAYDGAVCCGISRQDPRMKDLFRSYCKALQVSERQMRELDRLYAAFEENGIDYMPLKGCNMKKLYPRQELRLMGDADILIRMDQYDQIIPVMEQLGFEAGDVTDHELVWKSGGLYLELHKRLVPSHNKDYHAYFGDGWQLAKCHQGTQYSMTAEDAFLYLFAHFAKHFRGGGIGCRHVSDLWVYRRAHPSLDEAYIRAELQKLQLLEFYENTCCLIAVWFEDRPSDPKTDFMNEFIFASGSWGKIESRVLSETIRDSSRALPGISGKLVYLWKLAFPSAAVLQNKYTILKKRPYLVPLVWLIRPFYKILFEFGSLRRKKEYADALSRENLDERRQLLRHIGLDFHF